jgi:hypothetical protein
VSARKLWATRFGRIAGEMHRHESKAAVYRYAQAQAANWLAGALRSQHLTVYVDERDGRGWKTYEHIDLQEFGS